MRFDVIRSAAGRKGMDSWHGIDERANEHDSGICREGPPVLGGVGRVSGSWLW